MMRSSRLLIAAFAAVSVSQPTFASAQRAVLRDQSVAVDSTDPVALMVARLDLERYKATIKGLTTFGDRRAGTDRNRAAIDWIEAQLKSYGCTNTERITYEHLQFARPPATPTTPPSATAPTRPNPAVAGSAAAARRSGPPVAAGGGRARGIRTRTGVNNDSMAQPDEKLRALNSQPSTPGEREQVYCTKIGTTKPDEMYIIGGHMDGIGWGEAANDDGSGSAIVMELARIFFESRCTNRTFDSVHSVQQRRNRLEWRARVCAAARSTAGNRITCWFGQVSGAALAGHDSARHDVVRPWDAAR